MMVRHCEPRTRHPGPSYSAKSGFSLVEILIVVVLLAILAAMVMPQFTSATEETRENTLTANLTRLRQQIALYQHHHGEYPSLGNFVDQMTRATNAAGQTAAPDTPGYSYGPYINVVPNNPYTNGNQVGDGEPGSSDWYYDEDTGAFHANHTEAARELF